MLLIMKGELLSSFYLRRKVVLGSPLTNKDHEKVMHRLTLEWRLLPFFGVDEVKSFSQHNESLDDIYFRHTPLRAYSPTFPIELYVRVLDNCYGANIEHTHKVLPRKFHSVFSGFGRFKFCYKCLKDRLVEHGFFWFDTVWMLGGYDVCRTHQIPMKRLFCNRCGAKHYKTIQMLYSTFNGKCLFCNASMLEEGSFSDMVSYEDSWKKPFVTEYELFMKGYPMFSKYLIVKIIACALNISSTEYLDKASKTPFGQLTPYAQNRAALRNYFYGKSDFVPLEAFWDCARLVFDDDFKSFDKYIKKRTQVKIFNSKVLWNKAIHDFDVKVLVPC
ncbi:hypothetical protein [Vibrio alginolyticus]|uniref:hypothetical protein n=1 Tax=Vibrio alginolyticus TaxID=663 RepID=UPI001C0601D4|nr:hypothetical protein [Vibrio alginolyticus]